MVEVLSTLGFWATWTTQSALSYFLSNKGFAYLSNSINYWPKSQQRNFGPESVPKADGWGPSQDFPSEIIKSDSFVVYFIVFILLQV